MIGRGHEVRHSIDSKGFSCAWLSIQAILLIASSGLQVIHSESFTIYDPFEENRFELFFEPALSIGGIQHDFYKDDIEQFGYNVKGGQTYVGLELVGALSMVGLNGGVFKHIAGDDEDSDWIYSLGIGLGI